MFRCPDCSQELRRMPQHARVVWSCPDEHGQAITFAALKHDVDPVFLSNLWRMVRSEVFPKDRLCPDCRKEMYCISVVGATSLDICRTCTFIWFDSGKFDSVPKRMLKPNEQPLPPEFRRELALLEAKDKAEEIRDRAAKEPDLGWKLLPAALGLPVELVSTKHSSMPLATYAVGILIVLLSLLAFFDQRVFDLLALVPDQFNVFNLFSVFFVHANAAHLLGNLYFYFVFSDDTEHYLGHFKFLLLLAVSTLIASFLHIASDPESMTPTVGASGGISGVVAFYTLVLPRARLAILIRGLWFWLRFPAWVGFIGWVCFQIVSSLGEPDGVAYLAHLGGALGGVLFWIADRLYRAEENA